MTDERRKQLTIETKDFIQDNAHFDKEHPGRNPSPGPGIVIPAMQARHPDVDRDDWIEIARTAYRQAAEESFQHADELERYAKEREEQDALNELIQETGKFVRRRLDEEKFSPPVDGQVNVTALIDELGVMQHVRELQSDITENDLRHVAKLAAVTALLDFGKAEPS